jgi:CRISPR-associated protein (TIGR03986 family)
MNESTVHAPYNFVPFSERFPYIRYWGVSELPRHDALRGDLKSGEIRITLRAETPVFVSDGKEDPHFFRGPDGSFMIPGSTVRGMLRENMLILGYGTVRPGEDLEDYQVFYREMAAARDSTGAELKEVYQDTLGIETRTAANGKSYSIPTRVNGGHLFCEGGKYFIVPTREKYYRISRSDKLVQQFKTGDARVVDVAYTASGERITELLPAKAAKPGMTPGKLLFTGRPVGRQPNHLYLFSPPDPAAEREGISDEDILSYRMDLEARRNSLKAYYDAEFWALPKEGESKPVFYAAVDTHSHLYFGMTLFLHIGYPHSLAEGLPPKHRDLLAAIAGDGEALARLPQAYRDHWKAEEEPLDYPQAILGFAAKKTGQPSYRSRVSVGDFPLVNDAS